MSAEFDDQILSQSAGHIYWKDLTGRYLGCNEAFAKTCGLSSPAQIIGTTDADRVKNQVLLQRLQNTDKSVIQTGQETVLEEAGLDEKGNVAMYLTKKAPLRDNNQNIIGVIGTSINMSGYFDIRDYVIRHTTGNVYWKDLNGRYLGCNDAFAEMSGLTIPAEIVGKTDHELFDDTLGVDRVNAIVEIDQAIMSSGIEKTLEEVGIDRKGRLAVYMTKKVPLCDNSNAVIGIVGTSLDITKQRQSEIAKLEFLRNMSHDIMTPFSGILGISSILFEEENNPTKKTQLEYLMRSGERLLQLFRQILEVAEFGGRQVKLEEFNLHEVVNDTVEMVAVSARHKGLDIKVDCAHYEIKSDKLRIARILLNLLGNAIKFTDTGCIHVKVEMNSDLQISVEDTGVGIPADKLEIIFEKFQKLSESGKYNHFTGSGIGLFIAKQFALELGGDITVESEVGKGSRFCFSLPNPTVSMGQTQKQHEQIC